MEDDKTIHTLTEGTVPDGTEELAIWQAAGTKRITIGTLKSGIFPANSGGFLLNAGDGTFQWLLPTGSVNDNWSGGVASYNLSNPIKVVIMVAEVDADTQLNIIPHALSDITMTNVVIIINPTGVARAISAGDNCRFPTFNTSTTEVSILTLQWTKSDFDGAFMQQSFSQY